MDSKDQGIDPMTKTTFATLRAALAGLALAAGAALPAMADFRGGGILFGFTQECAADGWPVGGTITVLARYRDITLTPQDQASQLNLFLRSGGAINLSLWNTQMEPTPNFRRMTGRTIFGTFRFASNQPQVRVLVREIVTRLNPAGPATLANARSVAMRARIANFSDTVGCGVTFAGVMRRRN